MSWKNFASFALAALLASPVLAAPALNVTSGGLNAQGNWIWNVTVAADAALIAGGSSSLAVEVGFAASSTNLSAAPTLIAGTVFDTANPGNSPFAAPIAGVQNGIVRDGNNTFVAYGSSPVANGNANNFIQIVTVGPKAGGAGQTLATRTSTLTASGAYSGLGRIAQEGVNYTIADINNAIAGNQLAITRVATPGDTNLTGGVDLTDFNTVLSNLGTGQFWQNGNFDGNGTGTTDLTDFNTVLANLGQPSGGVTGVVAAAAVPEPATVAICGVLVAGLALSRRKQ